MLRFNQARIGGLPRVVSTFGRSIRWTNDTAITRLYTDRVMLPCQFDPDDLSPPDSASRSVLPDSVYSQLQMNYVADVECSSDGLHVVAVRDHGIVDELRRSSTREPTQSSSADSVIEKAETMNARHKTSRAKRRRGATAVEMAVVAPLFFLFAFAMFEFSRIGLVKQALTEAARAGCRKAVLATTLDGDDVETAVRENLQAVLSNPTHVQKCQFTISHADLSDVERGTDITTSIVVNCSDVSWIAPRYGENVLIRAESTMKRE
jgi:hypothetical protein